MPMTELTCPTINETSSIDRSIDGSGKMGNIQSRKKFPVWVLMHITEDGVMTSDERLKSAVERVEGGRLSDEQFQSVVNSPEFTAYIRPAHIRRFA